MLEALSLTSFFSAENCGFRISSEKTGEKTASESKVNLFWSSDGLVSRKYFEESYGDSVEEFRPVKIKVYTADELANDEIFKSLTINDDDIVFEADYELKIIDGYEDMNIFTVATGEIDGQWIKNKSNVGIIRSNGNVEVLGTSF